MMNNKTKNRYKENIHKKLLNAITDAKKRLETKKKKTKKRAFYAKQWDGRSEYCFVFSSIICIQTYKLHSTIGEEVMTLEIDPIGPASFPNGK